MAKNHRTIIEKFRLLQSSSSSEKNLYPTTYPKQPISATDSTTTNLLEIYFVSGFSSCRGVSSFCVQPISYLHVSNRFTFVTTEQAAPDQRFWQVGPICLFIRWVVFLPEEVGMPFIYSCNFLLFYKFWKVIIQH